MALPKNGGGGGARRQLPNTDFRGFVGTLFCNFIDNTNVIHTISYFIVKTSGGIFGCFAPLPSPPSWPNQRAVNVRTVIYQNTLHLNFDFYYDMAYLF